MMNSYTEQDIQDYLDGSFTGDVNGLRTYLEQDAEGQKQLQLYTLLYAGIKEQPPVSLSIDLAGAVITRCKQRAAAKEQRRTLASLLAMAMLAALALGVGYRYLGMQSLPNAIAPGLLVAFLPVLIAFVTGFHFIELQVKKKKFFSLFQ